MTLYVVSFLITFIYIFLKATQQINVIEKTYKWVFPTSIGMGLCEVAIVLLVVKADSMMLGLANGIAGGAGCILAMRTNFFKR